MWTEEQIDLLVRVVWEVFEMERDGEACVEGGLGREEGQEGGSEEMDDTYVS